MTGRESGRGTPGIQTPSYILSPLSPGPNQKFRMPISFSPFLPFGAFGNTAGKPAAFFISNCPEFGNSRKVVCHWYMSADLTHSAGFRIDKKDAGFPASKTNSYNLFVQIDQFVFTRPQTDLRRGL